MTGFGRGETTLGQGRVAVEARSVNHRTMEVRLIAPRELSSLQADLTDVARKCLRRGRVEFYVWLEGETGLRVALDRSLGRDAYRALCALRDEVAPGEAVPLSMLASVPDLFSAPTSPVSEPTRDAVRSAAERAVEDLDRMRGHEGAALQQDLSARLTRVAELALELSVRAPEALERARRRLRERIERLLCERRNELDPGRIEQEVALYADRTDIAEELTRLRSHCEQLDALFGREGPIGRRLDFMLQELAREANTIGAKSQDTATAHLVVELKTEIERMREQVQNVE